MQPRLATRSCVHSPRRGFNLIEAAIVLGIIGLVIGGIWVAASSVNFNRQLTDTVQGILQIQQNASQILGPSRGAMTGITALNSTTNSELARLIFPASWRQGTRYVMPNGRDAQISVWPPDRISLDFYFSSRAECLQLHQRLKPYLSNSSPFSTGGHTAPVLYWYHVYGYLTFGSPQIDYDDACADSVDNLYPVMLFLSY